MAVAEGHHNAPAASKIRPGVPSAGEAVRPRSGQCSAISLAFGPAGIFLLLFLLLINWPSPAQALRFNANWLYRESGGENLDTQRLFQQRYSLGVGQALSYSPTHAISFAAGLGYTRSQGGSSRSGGFSSTDQLNPFAQIRLVNDIFRTGLSGSSTRYYRERGLDKTDSWDYSLASSWVIPLFPSLRFNYGESTESFEFSSGLEEPGTKFTNSNVTVDWDLVLAQLVYRHSNGQSEDLSSGSIVKSSSHFVRVQTGGRFWDKRVGFNIAQQFTKTNQDLTLGNPEGGTFDVDLGGQTSSAVTSPVTLPDPLPEPLPDENIGLALNTQLSDDDYETTALSVPTDQRMHFSIRLDLEEQIGQRTDILRLTLDPLTQLTEEQAVAMEWSLYRRSGFDNTSWELVSDHIQVTYDSTEKRLDLDIGLEDPEIMVLAVNETDISLDFTELEAFGRFTEDFSSSTTGYLTNANVSYKITETLRASSSLQLDHRVTGFGDNSQDNDRRIISGRLGWTPVAYLSPSLGFSEVKEDGSGDGEVIYRTYSMTLATIPLPTMHVTLNFTNNKRFEGGLQTSTADRYNITTSAQLYPDLSAALQLGYSDSETLDPDGVIIPTTSFLSYLRFNARLRKYLSAELSTNYFRNENSLTNVTNDSSSARFGMKYRPSDLLSIRGSYETVLIGASGSDRLGLGMNLGLLNTYKARLFLNTTYRKAEESRIGVNLNGSWDISRNLAMLSRANFTIGDRNLYNFEIRLALRL